MALSASQAKTKPLAKSVVIIGAGPVGLFLAYKLGRANINVTVLEKEAETSNAPRACGYFAGSLLALIDAGLYDKILEEGFLVRGLCWRSKPDDDENGNKVLGEVIAAQPFAKPGVEQMRPGEGCLCLQQSLLTMLFLREALATGCVEVFFGREICAIEDDAELVTVTHKGTETRELERLTASFVVGADGGRSTTRKLLGITFPGHTWPEKFIATDVMKTNSTMPDYPIHFVFDPINFAVVVPLTKPILGERSLWRYAIAIDPGDTRSDEELLADEHIHGLYELVMDGVRPLQFDIKNRSVYRLHQRLASTLRKGRSVLVGDAAHLCNPYGALGLNSGLLDADALADALTMIINEGQPMSLLDLYSDERCKVFQEFVDPTSTYNKLRVQHNTPETAKDDWYLRKLRNLNEKRAREISKPYFEFWRTNIRQLAAEG